jgi:hypothetical protein
MNINSFIPKRLGPNLIAAHDLLQGLTLQAALLGRLGNVTPCFGQQVTDIVLVKTG